ncbi:MAG: PDZ domain-containing protein [Bacillota bacterium]
MKNKLLPVILTATAFGLLAGAVGALIAGVYGSSSLSVGSFNRELDLSSLGYLSPNLVIRDAKKVVVNQDVKADETIRDLRQSLLGVFVKKEGEAIYELHAPFAQALAATSDGWVMAAWPKVPSKAEIETIKDTYVVVDDSRKVYAVDQVLSSEGAGAFIFLHLASSSGLNVRRLSPDSDIKAGQSLIISSALDSFLLDSLQSKSMASSLLSSDSYPLTLRFAAGSALKPAYAFNLNGDLVAAVDAQGRQLAGPVLDAYWRSLLRKQDLSLPSLGVNYLDLSAVAIGGSRSYPEKGALLKVRGELPAVIKGGPADKAGLIAGDIIVRLDGIEINADNNLSVLLATYEAGDRVTVSYLRKNLPAQVEVTLGEAK